ncbi:hypothetical protein [Paraburkholderia tropica]|uniref:hypothetical protein n=1 Tax=Paraburkholderia tropica TaxID=92647 RepID=UPI002AB649FB|nr:hypothetical protein [Paraburkholderia tropica]
MAEKTNTAHLIALLKAKLARVESASAKGIDRNAAFEIAEFSGQAMHLHYLAEEELAAGQSSEENRAKQARLAAAGMGAI